MGRSARVGGMLPTGKQRGHPPSLVEEGIQWDILTHAGAGCGEKILTVKTKNVMSKNIYPTPALLSPPPNPPETINALSHPQQRQRRVTFQLPHKHINCNITA